MREGASFPAEGKSRKCRGHVARTGTIRACTGPLRSACPLDDTDRHIPTMALETPESLSDPFALGDSDGSAPDSSPLRVSTNTQFESGVPPARREEAREHAGGTAGFELGLTLDSG